MKRAVFVPTLTLLISSTAYAQQYEDPAPSGNEQAVIDATGTESVMGTPGSDAPVAETHSGNTIHLDYNQGDVQGANVPQDLNPDTTTVIDDAPTDSGDP